MKTLKIIGIIILVIIGVWIFGEVYEFVANIVFSIFSIAATIILVIGAILLFVYLLQWMFGNSGTISESKKQANSNKPKIVTNTIKTKEYASKEGFIDKNGTQYWEDEDKNNGLTFKEFWDY